MIPRSKIINPFRKPRGLSERVWQNSLRAGFQSEYFSLKARRRSIFFFTFKFCRLLRSEPLRRCRQERLSGKWSEEEDLRRSGKERLPPRSLILRISMVSATWQCLFPFIGLSLWMSPSMRKINDVLNSSV